MKLQRPGTTNLELEGKRFGKLLVRESLEERVSGHIMWRCVCDCGVETTVRGGSLTSGNTNSCGCLKSRIRKNNKYGKLTAIKRIKVDNQWKWHCKCDCGGKIDVLAGNLGSGNTESCGCLIPIDKYIDEDIRVRERRELARNGDINYSTWRRHVRIRDNNTCVICGYIHKEKYDIDVHHLDVYFWCAERRTDISNGVVLCSKNCHQNFHNKYGTDNNTEEQFKEFYFNKTGKEFKQKEYNR